MKKLLVILNVIFLLTAGFVLTTGCQGGASCKETCDENDDCGWPASRSFPHQRQL